MPVFSVLFLIGFLNALHHNSANLSIYFSECGFTKDVIGMFCLLGFPFSLKIIWSPIIDTVSIPFLKNSPRKGWLVVALLSIALSFFGMSFFDPKINPWLFGACICSLSLFAGCLYMVGIAYELESIPSSSYNAGSACLIAGYRTGLLYAGAGVLFVAHIASWSFAFQLSCVISIVAAFIILVIKEPYNSSHTLAAKKTALSKYPSFFKGILYETLLQPCKTFFQSGNWKAIFAVIILFKVGDHMAKPMEGPFYLELGFSKADLALAAKTFGFVATILGAFCAAGLLKDKNPFYAVAILGLVHTCSEFGCLLHSLTGKSYTLLYLTSGISNFTGGMVITAFTALLWKSCDKTYATVQYALLWSLSSFATRLMACCGGFLAANLSWPQFFTTICSVSLLSSLMLLVIVLQPKAEGQFHEIRM